MNDFWKWFDGERDKAAPFIEWLNNNIRVDGQTSDWDVYHSGGGFMHYVAEGEIDGCKVELLLDHGGDLETTFKPSDDCTWVLIASKIDADNEIIEQATLAEAHDIRNLVERIDFPMIWEEI